MADDEYGRVPAGWYPDPLGLPQLRWWDNHAWTEHVSDARQPMVPTENAGTATAFADDELPRRRDRRSAESADGTPVDDVPVEQPTAHVLRQLAPPVADAQVSAADAAAEAAAAREAAEAAARAAAEEAARAAAREAAAREAAERAAREAEERAAQEAAERARVEAERLAAERREAERLAAERAEAERQAAARTSTPLGTPGADSAPPQASRPAANAADAFAAAAYSDPAASASTASGTGTTSPAASPWVPISRDDPQTAEPRSARSSVNSASSQASVASAASFAGSAPIDFGPAPTYGSSPRPSAPGFGSAPGYVSAPGFGSAPGYSGSAPGYGSVPGYGSSSAPGFGSAPVAPYAQAAGDAPVAAGRRGAFAAGGPAGVVGLHTVEAWAIALLPMLQLLLSLLVVSAFATGPSLEFMAAIWLGPYPIVVGLALLDARRLKRLGLDRAASGWWALAGPIVYLIVRAMRISRVSGVGFGPVAVWVILTALMGASIIAVPGLVIAAFPGVFAEQANQVIESSSRSIGANLESNCPATPPLYIGQQMRCPAVNPAGEPYVVTVSLQRANGWIAWQVDDWGVFGFER